MPGLTTVILFQLLQHAGAMFPKQLPAAEMPDVPAANRAIRNSLNWKGIREDRV